MANTLPEVPPGDDFRLQYFLKQLRNEVLRLQGTAGEDGIVGTDDDIISSSGFNLTISGATIAGTGESVSTEDAWTTVASGVADGARYVYVQCYMESTSDDAGGSISIRTSSGSLEIFAVYVKNNGSSDADRTPVAAYILPVTEGGNFDYIANSTHGSVDWWIKRLGYIA